MKIRRDIVIGLAFVLFALLWYWIMGAEQAKNGDLPPPPIPLPNELDNWANENFADDFAERLWAAITPYGKHAALNALMDNMLLMPPNLLDMVVEKWNSKYNPKGYYTLAYALSKEWCLLTSLDCGLRDSLVERLTYLNKRTDSVLH